MLFLKFCYNGNHELHSIQSDSFYILQKRYVRELLLILKHLYKLPSKAPSPTNLERQNVNLVQQIFNEYPIHGLLTLGEQKSLSNFADVAEYINIFYIWLTILDMKRPHKGC